MLTAEGRADARSPLAVAGSSGAARCGGEGPVGWRRRPRRELLYARAVNATDPERPRTVLERIAQRTHGVVTPANALDVLAMVGVSWSAPRLDRWSGIAVAVPSYLADVADGMIARRTNTSSRFGELVDHVGDKPKVFLGLRAIWRLGIADKRLLAAVGCYNLANAALACYDVAVNEEPQIEVTRRAKRAMFATTTGVGVQAIGHKIAETSPRLGRLVIWGAALLGYGGVLAFGVPTTVDYWNMARRGKRRAALVARR